MALQKMIVNPRFDPEATAKADSGKFSTLDDMLAFHAESERIALAYVASRLNKSSDAIEAQCQAAGVSVVVDA